MKRLRSQLLATWLGGGPLMMLAAMADDCAGAKVGGATGVSITGVSTTVNINAAAGAAAEGAAQGADPSAGKKSGTEYEGTPQHGCLPSRPEVCW